MSIIPPEERMLSALNQKVEDTNKRLERIEKLLADVVGMMSDELAGRNPLRER